jgi:diguanylate cyclase (GGDEF)-like protein
LAVFRVYVLVSHNLTDEETRRRDSRRWEKLYALGGVGFMTAVGVTAALLFTRHDDELTALYGFVISLGCAGALAGRNAGRPLIVIGQVLGVVGPLTLTLLFQHDAWHWGLAAILVLVMTSVKSTTAFLNGMLVSALLNSREARSQRARLGTALNSMSHGLCMGDEEGVVTVINHRLEEFFHLEGENTGMPARSLAERIAASGDMSSEARAEFVQTWETHVSKRDASVFTETIGGRIYDFRCEPMEKGGFVVVVEDVTDARIASRDVERMARFDTLTGLPNRLHFHAQLEAALKQALVSGQELALLTVDLDRFKDVNDTLGHPMGDQLLCQVAERLTNAVAGYGLVSRFGGDEFQVLLQSASHGADAPAVAKMLIDVLSSRFTVDGHTISIGASVGMAFAPSDASTPDELLRCADMALYQAKAAGRGVYAAFTPDMDIAAQRKRGIEQELREAIANGHLEVHYQPIVDTWTGGVVACEALARWRHPIKGMIPPSEFIQVAEDTGLIVEIGDFVLQRACIDALTWPKHVRVAVNFSVKQFMLKPTLADDIKTVLDTVGLTPDRLEVEITESGLVEAEEAVAQLKTLFLSGVRLSLDDFGTGYSSLSYLRQFSVHKIKLDRSFIHNLEEKSSQAVIGSVSLLANLLEVDLVMEGVETEPQLRIVNALNVHLIQGYLFSRPVPAEDLLLLLSQPVFPTPVRLQNVA